MRSIQSIIFLRFLLVVTIVFALAAAGLYFLTSRTLRRVVVSDGVRSVTFVVNNVRQHYRDQLATLDTLARMSCFSPYNGPGARTFVDNFLKFDGFYATIHAYRKDGGLLFARRRAGVASYGTARNFHERHDKVYVRLAEAVLRDGRPRLPDTFYTRSGQLYQIYIAPLRDPEGRIYGILSGGVFPQQHRIDRVVEGLELGPANFVLVSDNKGNVLARKGPPLPEGLSGHLLRAAERLFGPAGRGEVFMEEQPGGAGPSHFLFSMPIAELRLLVTLGVSTRIVSEELSQLSRYTLGVLAAGFALTVFASLLVGSRLAMPFRMIADAVRRIGAGEFSVRVEYAEKDEIGYLCGLVNRLGAKLGKNARVLELWDHGEDDADGGAPRP